MGEVNPSSATLLDHDHDHDHVYESQDSDAEIFAKETSRR